MRVTMTATFVADEEAVVDRLKRLVEAVIVEHGETWVVEVDVEIDRSEEQKG